MTWTELYEKLDKSETELILVQCIASICGQPPFPGALDVYERHRRIVQDDLAEADRLREVLAGVA